MTNYRKLIPFIMLWEEGIKTSLYNSMPWSDYFAVCKSKGVHVVPGDSGGATVCGVTIGTYKSYRKAKGLEAPQVEDLVQISAEEWLEVYKTMFWDKCKGDRFISQATADMLVDWYWTSGTYAIRRLQKIACVTQDGIIGPITLGAVNALCQEDWKGFLERFKQERIQYYKDIVKKSPAKKKFLNGWINRANACAKWK